MDVIKIGGRNVRALRHGMAGAPGLEIWGPYEEREEIRETSWKPARRFGIVQVWGSSLRNEHARIRMDPFTIAAVTRIHA
jgi:glycine cleavage system aminomethyltransferase T